MSIYRDTNILLPTLVRAVGETYPGDKTRPSVLVSYIDENKKWYVSIGRYFDGQTKRIIQTAYGDTLDRALMDVAKVFMKSDPMPEYRRYLADLLA